MVAKISFRIVKEKFKMKNDSFNDRILRELANDGRISNHELAQRIGLSPSACLRRVQELESSGLIRGYKVILELYFTHVISWLTTIWF